MNMKYLIFILLLLTGCVSNNQDPLLNYLYNNKIADTSGCTFMVTKKSYTTYVIKFLENESSETCRYKPIYSKYKEMTKK